VCDDGQVCTYDFADEVNGCICSHEPAFLGEPCDDGSVCTSATVCDGLGGDVTHCNGGTTLDCDDDNPCTNDSCDPLSGCGHTNNTAACEDGDACTTGDLCGGGVCSSGGPLVCNDANPCTTDSCSSATGCVFASNTGACNDGNACTQVDACSGGACVGGNPIICVASDSCHLAGICAPGTGVCSNPAKPSGAACDDGEVCTVGDTCNGAATCVGGPAPSCDDGNACTADLCEPGTGCSSRVANFDATGFSATRVDGRDLVVFALAWNSCPVDPLYNAAANLDQETTPLGSCIDASDFHLFMNAFGRSCP
jgi:hypothetical protein